jgi:hypothetical protein
VWGRHPHPPCCRTPPSAASPPHGMTHRPSPPAPPRRCKSCYGQRLFYDHYSYYWLDAGKCLSYRVYFPTETSTTTSAAD